MSSKVKEVERLRKQAVKAAKAIMKEGPPIAAALLLLLGMQRGLLVRFHACKPEPDFRASSRSASALWWSWARKLTDPLGVSRSIANRGTQIAITLALH